jgi:hypothetical protein
LRPHVPSASPAMSPGAMASREVGAEPICRRAVRTGVMASVVVWRGSDSISRKAKQKTGPGESMCSRLSRRVSLLSAGGFGMAWTCRRAQVQWPVIASGIAPSSRCRKSALVLTCRWHRSGLSRHVDVRTVATRTQGPSSSAEISRQAQVRHRVKPRRVAASRTR